MGSGNNANGLWRGMSALTASLCAMAVAGTAIAQSNAGFINAALGVSNYSVQNIGDGQTGDATYFDSEFTSLNDLIDAKTDLAERISEEGSVLLKNEHAALPLDKGLETVTLWGMNSHTPTLGGLIGSSVMEVPESGQQSYDVERALSEKGFNLNQEMISLYSGDEAAAYARHGFGQTGHGLTPSFASKYDDENEYQVGEIPSSLYSEDVLASADGTVGIVVISRDSSEAADYTSETKNGTAGDSFERPLALSEYERDMIALAKAHSTKTVVLINADNPMELDELKNDEGIDAILWVGLPGMYGFLGVADVLSGDANPSGHLVDTYAVNAESSPAMVNWGVHTYSNASNAGAAAELDENDRGDWYLVESEGIYIGYKYYETRYEDAVLDQGQADSAAGSSSGAGWDYATEVSYPFGYGMSYTTFDQRLRDVSVDIGGEDSFAEVEVTNTGEVPGKSVVELYVQTPYDGSIEKSSIQLVGIGKTGELEPGESETVRVSSRCLI